MTTLDEEPGRQLWYHAKGAPLELLERCAEIRTLDGDRRSATQTTRRCEQRLSAMPPRACACSGSHTVTSPTRAWLRLGALEALLVLGGFFFVLLAAGWSPGTATGSGTPLHHAYLTTTTMTWAGIVACQIGAAFAVRTSHASLRQVGLFSNPHLLRGVAFALAFAAAVIYAPPLQAIFNTSALPVHDLLVLACFPVIVWGSDELWRWHLRRRGRG
jgi:Cation transporting ATPase, C-terminus